MGLVMSNVSFTGQDNDILPEKKKFLIKRDFKPTGGEILFDPGHNWTF